MKLKIIQKYLIFELLPQFFMAMFIFSFITCLAELFTQQNNFSFGFDFVFWSKISFFLLLQNAALIVPISFFYACLVSLGQMILQNEIIALKSCGFSYFILLRPLLLMATCLSIICFLVAGFLQPWGYKSVKYIFSKFIQKKNVQLIKERIFNEGFFEYIMYVEKVQQVEKKMNNIILIPKDSSGSESSVIFAKTGMLYQTEDPSVMIFQLNNGSYNQYSDNFQQLDFEKANVKLSYSESSEIGKFEKKKNFFSLWQGKNGDRRVQKQLAKIINNSLLPLVFCIFGFGFFGILSKPSRGLSFFITILIISFYHGFRAIEAIRMGPYLEATIPNIVILAVALFLIYRASKR